MALLFPEYRLDWFGALVGVSGALTFNQGVALG